MTEHESLRQEFERTGRLDPDNLHDGHLRTLERFGITDVEDFPDDGLNDQRWDTLQRARRPGRSQPALPIWDGAKR